MIIAPSGCWGRLAAWLSDRTDDARPCAQDMRAQHDDDDDDDADADDYDDDDDDDEDDDDDDDDGDDDV